MLTEKVHLIQFKLHFHISGSTHLYPPPSGWSLPETRPPYPLVFATYGSISLKSFSTYTHTHARPEQLANYNPAPCPPPSSCSRLCYLNLQAATTSGLCYWNSFSAPVWFFLSTVVTKPQKKNRKKTAWAWAWTWTQPKSSQAEPYQTEPNWTEPTELAYYFVNIVNPPTWHCTCNQTPLSEPNWSGSVPHGLSSLSLWPGAGSVNICYGELLSQVSFVYITSNVCKYTYMVTLSPKKEFNKVSLNFRNVINFPLLNFLD